MMQFSKRWASGALTVTLFQCLIIMCYLRGKGVRFDPWFGSRVMMGHSCHGSLWPGICVKVKQKRIKRRIWVTISFSNQFWVILTQKRSIPLGPGHGFNFNPGAILTRERIRRKKEREKAYLETKHIIFLLHFNTETYGSVEGTYRNKSSHTTYFLIIMS